MLGDESAADALLSHPLVQTDLESPVKKRRSPSYLSSLNFALALVDVLLDSKPADSKRPLKPIKAKVEAMGDSSLGSQLRPLLGEAGKDLAAFRESLEKWFDDSMDRVSGWYRRKSQIATVLVAIVVAVGLNASTIRIAERLSNDPTVRAAVVKKAEGSLAASEADATAAETEADETATAEGKEGGARHC